MIVDETESTDIVIDNEVYLLKYGVYMTEDGKVKLIQCDGVAPIHLANIAREFYLPLREKFEKLKMPKRVVEAVEKTVLGNAPNIIKMEFEADQNQKEEQENG